MESALRRAVTFRDGESGDTAKVIFHADRGCQYTSTQLADVAEELDVRLSVGWTGGCWDNAQQESFWLTLKTEYYQRHSFRDPCRRHQDGQLMDRDCLQPPRRHSALGQISPVAFEHQLITAAAEAA